METQEDANSLVLILPQEEMYFVVIDVWRTACASECKHPFISKIWLGTSLGTVVGPARTA